MKMTERNMKAIMKAKRLLGMILLSILLQIGFQTQAQSNTTIDTTLIIQIVKKTPRRVAKNHELLAIYLTETLPNQSSKVFAINYWITKNIKYDYDSYISGNISALSSYQVLQGGKAICGEYSQLLTDMCSSVGIKSAVVSGYIKDFDFFEGDTLFRAEHAWSVVLVDNKWTVHDLTWASGGTVYKKQYIAKMLWKYFQVPYILKEKWVQKMDLNWVNVDPERMKYSHHSTLDMFQISSNPITLRTFELGADSIMNSKSSPYDYKAEIGSFLSLNEEQQYLLEANEGHRNNPNNHRVYGFNYYQASNYVFNKYVNYKYKIISTSVDSLMYLSLYNRISDSTLRLALDGNKKEYLTKEARSNDWKSELKSTNKELILRAKNKVKSNKKQVRLIDNTNKKKKAYIKYANALVTKLDKKQMPTLKHAINKETANQPMSQKLLIQADSLHNIASLKLSQKDSLLSVFSKEDQYYIITTEDSVLNLIIENRDDILAVLGYKRSVFPQIYLSNTLIKKEWISDKQLLSDSLNETITASILQSLYDNQIAANSLMKEYKILMKEAMGNIKKAMKLSVIDQNEKELYLKYKDEYRAAFIDYSTQLSNYQAYPKGIKKTLKAEYKPLYKSVSHLKKETSFENYRHRSYMKYVKSKRKKEDSVIKQLLKEVKVIQKYIDKTEAYKLKVSQQK
jgi:hypothetical protein